MLNILYVVFVGQMYSFMEGYRVNQSMTSSAGRNWKVNITFLSAIWLESFYYTVEWFYLIRNEVTYRKVQFIAYTVQMSIR